MERRKISRNIVPAVRYVRLFRQPVRSKESRRGADEQQPRGRLQRVLRQHEARREQSRGRWAGQGGGQRGRRRGGRDGARLI